MRFRGSISVGLAVVGWVFVAGAIHAFSQSQTSGPAFPPSNTNIDVAAQQGNGNVNQAIPSGAFTKVNLTFVNYDPGNNFSTANSAYIVPSDGYYLITGYLRTLDGTAAGTQYSVSVYSSTADGSWNYWTKVGPSGGGNRSGFAYARCSFFVKGTSLSMYTYSDQGFTVMNAGLQINRLN